MELLNAGKSESRLRDAFKAAQQEAEQGKCAILFFDEVDALCPRRVSGQDHEVRVVAQMLTLMDGAIQHAGQRDIDFKPFQEGKDTFSGTLSCLVS